MNQEYQEFESANSASLPMWLTKVGEIGLSTCDLAGCGGIIKESAEDFRVDEIPLYEPCGSGEHLYVLLQRSNMAHFDMVTHLCRSLGVGERDIGYAGIKDKVATITAWVSLPQRVSVQLSQLETESLRILKVERHTNKLRTGHLKGNFFTIVIRDIENPLKVAPIIERLRESGCINFFGSQRFGARGGNIRAAINLMQGNRIGGYFKNHSMKKMAASAIQSLAFQYYAFVRWGLGLHRREFPGDVFANVHGLVESNSQRRITGPIFGCKSRLASGWPGYLEGRVLEAFGLDLEKFGAFGDLALGSRRPLTLDLSQLEFFLDNNQCTFKFFLPSGSYATVVLSEIIKPAHRLANY